MRASTSAASAPQYAATFGSIGGASPVLDDEEEDDDTSPVDVPASVVVESAGALGLPHAARSIIHQARTDPRLAARGERAEYRERRQRRRWQGARTKEYRVYFELRATQPPSSGAVLSVLGPFTTGC